MHDVSSLKSPASKRPSQSALKPPINDKALTNGVETKEQRINGWMSEDNKDNFTDEPHATQSDDNGGLGNDLLDTSITLSFDQAAKEESLKLKELEDMSTEHLATELLDKRGLGTDTSIERNAAQIWPYCARACQNCQRTHVAIPGSTVSQDCVRISMFIQKEPALAADQAKPQTSLVPTDEYELAVLGWLVWSTHAHQVVVVERWLWRVVLCIAFD